jgi:hypothetical protein
MDKLMLKTLGRLIREGKTSIEALNETTKFYGLSQDEALGLWERFIDG